MKNIETFKNLFVFNKQLTGYISCEREFFLKDNNGNFVPLSKNFLDTVSDNKYFSYELSACQVEYKTGPMKDVDSLIKRIDELENQCKPIDKKLRLTRELIEVAPDSVPLNVYPNERYLAFVKTKSSDQILDMIRITACQFHIGMPDYETALKVYNSIIPDIEELIKLGDFSNGERIRIYKSAAPHYQATPINSIEEHYNQAIEYGYDEDLNSCHTLIRITKYGTIEFRMFGAAKDNNTIRLLAEKCLSYLENLK